MPLLVIRGTGRYHGKEDSELSFGEYCVLYRSLEEGGDGSVVVTHPASGPFPLVTLPAGSEEAPLIGGRCWRQPVGGQQFEMWIDEVLIEQPLRTQGATTT
jgi:hypothetical protein